MKRPLVAVVLAGGVASRFWPFGANKTFFPFFGSTLFDLTIRASLPSEVDRVVVVGSMQNREMIGKLAFPKPSVTVLQAQPLGMADALLSAKEELKGCRLLIIIADDVVPSDLYKRVIAQGEKDDVFAVIAGWKPKAYFPGGYLKSDGSRVLGIIEKPEPEAVPSPYVAVSGHYVRDSDVLFSELAKTSRGNDDVYERTMTMLALRNNILVCPYEGAFASLKYPWNVLDVLATLWENGFHTHKGKGVDIKSNVIIEGNVYLGDNVKIFENTKIVGPVYIGDNTIIGNNNIIRASHIGKNCVTGFNTDITRSYVGDDCWFHSNYIGDSVLERNISMGSGAVLANLRLDDGEISSVVKEVKLKTGRTKLGSMVGDGVRIGVNASIMPGIKIGRGSFIGAGVTLDRDIPEASFVSGAKNSYTITSNTRTTTASRDEFKNIL